MGAECIFALPSLTPPPLLLPAFLPYFLSHLTLWVTLDAVMWRIVHPHKAAAPLRAAAAWLLREASGFSMWIVGLRTRVVHWRGRDFAIGNDGRSWQIEKKHA